MYYKVLIYRDFDNRIIDHFITLCICVCVLALHMHACVYVCVYKTHTNSARFNSQPLAIFRPILAFGRPNFFIGHASSIKQQCNSF